MGKPCAGSWSLTMSKGSRVLASLLAVVAVLLAANLFVTWTPSATAQGPARPTATIVRYFANGTGNGGWVFREWSDGRIEWKYTAGAWVDSNTWTPWKTMPQN